MLVRTVGIDPIGVFCQPHSDDRGWPFPAKRLAKRTAPPWRWPAYRRCNGAVANRPKQNGPPVHPRQAVSLASGRGDPALGRTLAEFHYESASARAALLWLPRVSFSSPVTSRNASQDWFGVRRPTPACSANAHDDEASLLDVLAKTFGDDPRHQVQAQRERVVRIGRVGSARRLELAGRGLAASGSRNVAADIHSKECALAKMARC